jgi:hypothetical protein
MDLERCLRVAWDATDTAGPLEVPTADERAAILDFTRAVAHASERTAAPIAAFAAGLALAGSEPGARAALIRRATAAIDAAAGSDEGAAASA